MQGTILLNYNDNTKKIENEEKLRFIKSVLEQIGLPINDFWFSDEILTIDQKLQLRKVLNIYNISIQDDLDGSLQILVENELVASWEKPIYKLKKDVQPSNHRKPYYLEMSINYWTLFEENQNQ